MSNLQKKFEKWMLDVVKEYTEVLNLQSFTLQDTKLIDDATDDAVFRIHTNYPYKGYALRYMPSALHMYKEGDEKWLRHGLMHELLHLVLAELVAKANTRSTRSEVDDAMETTVDHLAVVLRKYA